MNKKKTNDFHSKLDWITQMAEFFGWKLEGIDEATGQMFFDKDRWRLFVWSTKMTVRIVKGREGYTRYHQNIDQIERTLENPANFFHRIKGQPQTAKRK